jgi:hypothetical protein
MSEFKVGTIAMVYGLVIDTADNGKCVTLVAQIDKNTGVFINPFDGKSYLVIPDIELSWLCDDGCVYRQTNLLPIGDKKPDLVKDKEKEYGH